MKDMQRNFALDCFRALAIMMVFTGHSILAYGSPPMFAPLQFGGTGVDLFFVLSGWLIGNQLLIEKKQFGDIEVSRFWFRRWMRTMPAYYAVLTITIFQLYITKDNFSFPWAHLFFLQNYIGNLDIFYVSWSLSVEEQFYLFIAPLFVFTLKLPKRYQIFVLLTLLICPTLFRYLDLYTSLNETHVRLDCCAMGVLLAYIKHYRASIWHVLQANINLSLAVSIFAYLFFYLARYNPEWEIVDPSKLLLSVLFGIWILWGDQTNYSPSGYLSKIVMHISTRSYAMYLLHIDSLALLKRIGLSEHFLAFYALALLLTLTLSECLYRVIELPFMRVRSNFSFVRSRSKKVELERYKENL
ncbi:acyltransferase [Alteromonas sp. 1_MG-2023]|uniref:acyltransferase family protein n=1 Tax=Alteromonas sp. 1_MG-2023 TaxID=3062669 RepID=UPI0026E11ABE|nr:acyltransferase [Alteromonas sp. 1_MG-2023]MDO6566321.1 acyltransferase [Alteromonas sp. 1_MG-2023]